MSNTVELSDDRKTMTIHSADGKRTAHVRSALPGGFTDEQAFKALTFDFTVDAQNKHTRAWRKHLVRGWYWYAVVSGGPPTWWRPRIKVGRVTMVGWLRTMIQFSIGREKDVQKLNTQNTNEGSST